MLYLFLHWTCQYHKYWHVKEEYMHQMGVDQMGRHPICHLLWIVRQWGHSLLILEGLHRTRGIIISTSHLVSKFYRSVNILHAWTVNSVKNPKTHCSNHLSSFSSMPDISSSTKNSHRRPQKLALLLWLHVNYSWNIVHRLCPNTGHIVSSHNTLLQQQFDGE